MKKENFIRIVPFFGNLGAFAVCSLIVAACIACVACFADVAGADTLTSKNGTKEIQVSGKLVKKNGNVYYKFKKMMEDPETGAMKPSGKTRKAFNYFLTKGKKSYYFNKSGKMVKGWTKINSDYYYFDRSTGVQKKGNKKRAVKVDGIKILKSGKAVKSAYNVEKIRTMMTARKIMLANTKYSDSKSSKRYKVFRWVMGGNYRQFRSLKSTGHRKGWELTFANDMFKRNRLGCCVSNACAFAFLAKECGYKNVYICDDTGHGFVKIDGKYFDTLFAETSGFYNYYNAPHSRATKDGVVNSLRI